MEDVLKRSNSHIYRAILKNGHAKFSLTILEYCEPNKCLIREKHYWDILNPEYNIAQDPTAPMSGRKHSDESRKKISDSKIGSKHSDESKQIMSDSHKKIDHSGRFTTGHKHLEETKKKISDANKGQVRPEGAGSPSQAIEVFDLQEKTKTTYNSIHAAARALNIPNFRAIANYIKNNQKKPYKGKYTFKKL
jgi:group I intron endonuclease